MGVCEKKHTILRTHTLCLAPPPLPLIAHTIGQYNFLADPTLLQYILYTIGDANMVVSRWRGIGPPSGIPPLGRCFCWPTNFVASQHHAAFGNLQASWEYPVVGCKIPRKENSPIFGFFSRSPLPTSPGSPEVDPMIDRNRRSG